MIARELTGPKKGLGSIISPWAKRKRLRCFGLTAGGSNCDGCSPTLDICPGLANSNAVDGWAGKT